MASLFSRNLRPAWRVSLAILVALVLSSFRDAETQPLKNLNVPLIVQESIYGEIKGIARQQEPVSVGIPLADSAGIQQASQLGLAGASAGQFRVLGRWPSGNIAWVLVDTLADVSAGKSNTSISLTGGSGNFGGPDLATESASSITISTGASTFIVRKNNFNMIDDAVVNRRELIKQGASLGLVILGPAPGNTTCPCSTIYSSAYDASSEAVVEENGPVRAVIRATGKLIDGSGHGYMRYTVRMHFSKAKATVKSIVILQNADYGPSNSFASAYKGFRSFEVRITPNFNPGKAFRFGGSTSVVAGSFAGPEDAFIYQAYSDKMEHPQWASPDVRGYYAPRSYIKRTLANQAGSHKKWTYRQEGCEVVGKVKMPTAAGQSDYCEGWADLSDASGAVIEVGTYEMAAYWPKSLQFVNGGSEIRVGIWPDQSLFGEGGQDYYQSWPQYSMHTIYFSFHSSASSDPGAEFERLQHPLIARARVSQYNESKALLYPIVDSDSEDKYFRSLGLACCAKDVSAPHVYRTYGWRAAGSGNQAEMRWANLMLWLQRGQVGRYVDASQFYTFQTEQVFPRSDYKEGIPFNWRDRPESELDPTGLPEPISSLNQNIDCDPGEMKCGRNWIDNAHAHWYGMIDYYFMTGDESIKDAILDGASDIYGNPNVKVVKNGTYYNPRNVGEALMSDARLALFYRAIGDREGENRALLAGTQVLSKQVWPELQLSGSGTASQGVSRTRGVHFGCCPPTQRFAMPFQEGILSEGLWEFLQAEGPDWPQRQLTFALAYGIASWTLNEAWRDEGKGEGCREGSGLAYEIFIDRPNDHLDPSCVHTVWFNFYNYAKYTGDPRLWNDKFTKYLQHINGNGVFYGEIGTVFEGAVVGVALNPEPLELVDVPAKADKSANTYRLTWTVPSAAQSYRIKYSDKNIVEWLGFDAVTNRFTVDPETNVPWFAALDAAAIPQPGPAGTTQTFEITGLDSAKQWHFAVKAYTRRNP
jgi:exo-rhamnogalacturonan lyase-like protein